MAKGLAVVYGRNTVVFKALEDGNIVLGNTAGGKPGIVTIDGSLKLDITGKSDGHFLKTDADGNASWAQINAVDVDVSASGLDLEAHLSAMDFAEDALSTSISGQLSAEAAARSAADAGLDSRLTTAESEIDTLQSDLSILIGGDIRLQATLSNIKEIQEYLDGDGVDVQNLVSVAGVGIGDLTTFTSNLSAQLSADIAELSSGSGGDLSVITAALSQEIVDRGLGDDAVSAGASTALASEVSARIVDVAAEETRASTAEYGLSVAIEDLDAVVSTNLSSSIVNITGTANEVEVSVAENASGKSVVVGLPDSVTITDQLNVNGQAIVAGNLTAQTNLFVEGSAELGNSDENTLGTALDAVVVKGTFQAPRLTRDQAESKYITNADPNDDYSGHMFYLTSDDAASDEAAFPEGKKWYFCENGVWYASFFYSGS